MRADPKPDPRIVDRDASARKLLADPVCRSCEERASNCHHLLGRGSQRGDDIEPNLIPLCGSGTTGCHGALHGNPYTDRWGRRWTAERVRRRIGRNVRHDEFLHLVAKLGTSNRAAEYLRRVYGAAPAWLTADA